MTWKWVVDRRSGSTRIDSRWLAIGAAGGLLVEMVLRALLSPGWFYLTLAILVPAEIAFDVWSRRGA
jgi:hypothetical protein